MAGISGRRIWASLAIGALSLGGVAAGAVMLAGRGDAAAVAAERPAQPVRVSRIDLAPVAQVATFTGTIRPSHEVAMGFRIAGKITVRPVEVGDRVTKGQVLAQLDDTDARLEQELAAAEAAAAEVDLRRAVAEAGRSRTLFAGGHLSQAGLDRALSAEAEATSRKDRAERALALATNRLAYTQLLAEVDGIVTATPSEAGQVVGAGTPVVSVALAGAADVVFALPEKDRDLLEGRTAHGTLWGVEGPDFALRLRDVSPDVDPAGRTYRVRMSVDAPDAAATFGRTVTVSLVAAPTEPVAAVPLAAVLDDGAGPGVWRVTGDRVERVAVDLVSVGGEIAMIRGALTAGDVIVSLGAHKIDPARPVRIVETYALAGD